MHERLFHGIGAGDDLAVVDTPARPDRRPHLLGEPDAARALRRSTAAARRSGSPRPPTTSDGWLATMRHIAIESGAFVVSAPQYIPASAFPADFPVPLPEGKDVFGRGGAVIVEPTEGDVIAGPLYGEEGIVIADCDLRIGLHAKRCSTPPGTTAARTRCCRCSRAPWLRARRAHGGDDGSERSSALNAQNPRRSRGFGVGDPGFEPGTSALSERRSNQLS